MREVGKSITREEIKKGDILLYTCKSKVSDGCFQFIIRVKNVPYGIFIVGSDVDILSKTRLGEFNESIPNYQGLWFNGDNAKELILLEENIIS